MKQRSQQRNNAAVSIPSSLPATNSVPSKSSSLLGNTASGPKQVPSQKTPQMQSGLTSKKTTQPMDIQHNSSMLNANPSQTGSQPLLQTQKFQAPIYPPPDTEIRQLDHATHASPKLTKSAKEQAHVIFSNQNVTHAQKTSPRTKHSKHEKMSAGSAANSNASLHGTMKKPASTHRANDESTGLIQNSGLILPRKHQLDTSARMGQATASSSNLQYSRTLVAALQTQGPGHGPSSTKTKDRLGKRMSGASGSTVHLSTLIGSSTKKNLNHRNGSTKIDSSNHGASSSTLTPQKNAESLNSKLKKKVSSPKQLKGQKQKRTLGGNTGSFQVQSTNSNSRGNLLITHNQLSYLKQSQQLQETRTRDSLVKKSMKSTMISQKKPSQQDLTQPNPSNFAQSMIQNGAKALTGVLSDSSFNNVTIRSNDKFNSTLNPKKTLGAKHRELKSMGSDMQNTHPLSAKHSKDVKKAIFSSTQNVNSTSNLNDNNYHSQRTGQQPTASNNNYLSSASMQELQATAPAKTSYNSNNVYQRQIYHSKNQSIVSYSSNNSRFTTTRPKNPTEGSLSSKGSVDSGANHFTLNKNSLLKNKLTQQAQQHGVQTVSLQIDPEYLVNKSISPQKGSNQPAAAYSGGQSASKFNLVNRGAASSGQFPVVHLSKQGQPMLSPRSGRVISQSMSTQNVVKSKASDLQQQPSQKRKLSMKLSQPQLQQSNSTEHYAVAQPKTDQQQISTKKNSQSAQKSGNVRSQPKVLKSTKAQDAIMEEQVEDSAQNTKRQSMEHVNHKVKENISEIVEASHIQNTGPNKSHSQSTLSSQQVKGQGKPTQLVSSSSQQYLVKALNLVLTKTGQAQPAKHDKAFNKSHSFIKRVERNQERLKVSLTDSQLQQLGNNSATQPQQQTESSGIKRQASDQNVGTSSKQLTSLRQQLKKQIAAQPANATRIHHANSVSDIQQSSLKETQPLQYLTQYNSNPQQPSSSIGNVDSFPMSYRQALALYGSRLTDYEKIEIQGYSEVHYLGLEAQKIKGTTLQGHNFGYDDDRGDYQVVMKDHLAYRWEVLDKLGSGSFGQALKCFDHKNQQMVAIKVIRNKKRFQYQAGVELRLLKYLKGKDKNDENNIVRILDFDIFRKHLLISFELLSINLYEFIKQNNFQGVSTGLIRRFAIQILQALKFQRDHAIIHCDLKPENILLKQPNKSGIKIIDYGSSCFQNQRIYTYIQSRFYRAPEIILGIPYTTAIDMWSFGCIMAELYTGYPLFPGENEAEQLAYVMEIKGIPADYIIELSSRRNLFFERDTTSPIIVTNSRGRRRLPNTKTLQNVLKKCQDLKFLDFIDQCLDWDPVNRMTPLEALQHEWILEGLPEKVLVHHRRMFGGREDKLNLKEASLTAVQGFPEEANSKSIYDIVNELKIADKRKQRAESSGTDHIIPNMRSELSQGQNQSSRASESAHKTQSKPRTEKQQVNQSIISNNDSVKQAYASQPGHKFQSIIVQSQSASKPDDIASADAVMKKKTASDSPGTKRKIARGNHQSQSTKILPQHPQAMHQPKVNTLTILSSESNGQSKPSQNLEKSKSIPNIKQPPVGSAADIQSVSSGKGVMSRKLLANQTNSASSPYLESQTEQQDHVKSPSAKQSEELTQMKKLALITKNSSALPLKTAKKLMGREDGTDGDLGENISSDPEGHIKLKSCETKSNANAQISYSEGYPKYEMVQLTSKAPERQNPKQKAFEEDDFEDMMMPTDDEGPTSYTQTQKIPISLIKKQDKATKLFQGLPTSGSAGASSSNNQTALCNVQELQELKSDRKTSGKIPSTNKKREPPRSPQFGMESSKMPGFGSSSSIKAKAVGLSGRNRKTNMPANPSKSSLTRPQ